MSGSLEHHHGRHVATVRLAPKVYRFLNERRHADRLSIQQILAAGVAAYIVGDLEVTHEGYRVKPARSERAPSVVIEHADGTEETFTLEDAEIAREIVTHALSRPRDLGLNRRLEDPWGTRELAAWLEEELERSVSLEGLRAFLRRRFAKPEGQREWRWSGPDDPEVAKIKETIEEFGLFGDADIRRKLGVTRRELLAAERRHEDHKRARSTRGRRRAARSTG